MLRLLRTGVQFDAVFAHNDNMILDVLDAMESAKFAGSRVLIGFDAIREAVRAVQQGKLTATYLAVRSAVRLLGGEQIHKNLAILKAQAISPRIQTSGN